LYPLLHLIRQIPIINKLNDGDLSLAKIMNFVDTHTHLYDDDFAEDIDATVSRAVGAGVTKMILPDVSSNSRASMFSLAARYPGTMFPCLGVHPTEISGDWRHETDLMTAEKNRTDIVAIGETGMDLHWSKDAAKEQEEVFRVQIELSLEMHLPLIIHSRDAAGLTLKILEDYRGRGLKGVFHAYGGSIETFRDIERYGDFYIGIGGVVTFKNASIAETIKSIPMDRILTETDSPWLTPSPHRGTRNESSYIPIIASKIAEQKGMDVLQVAETSWTNAHKLFNI